MLLRTGPALLGVGGRRLTAVAAHERRQNSRIVHAPIQSPEQRPHPLGDDRGAAAAVSVCASSPDRKRLHLQLLPSLSVCVLGGCHADGVLPPVAEATVLVLMVLQEVVDRSQPQSATWA